MDYYKIGQKIRKIRKAHGLSQEELAEKVGISTTHMSHIETGNTKLSLPVFVDIAGALEVRTDDLLDTPATATTSTSLDEIATALERCSAQEAKVIADVVKAAKRSIDKHLYEGIGTHSFRKWYATEIYKANGCDIALVQRLLQHSSAETTQRYIGIEPQRIEKAIEGHATLL